MAKKKPKEISDPGVQAALKQRMRELREARGLNQYQAAEGLGIAQSSYSDLEQGDTRIRRRDLLAFTAVVSTKPEEAFPNVFGPEPTVVG